jgi:hypothetical protein
VNAARVKKSLRALLVAIDEHDAATFSMWQRLTTDATHAESQLRSACGEAVRTIASELGVELGGDDA